MTFTQYLPASIGIADALLTQECSITLPMETETGPWGERTDVTLHESLPCLLTRVSGREAENAALTNSSAMYRLRLPHGTDVPNTATVVIGDEKYPVVANRTQPLGIFTVLWLGAERG